MENNTITTLIKRYRINPTLVKKWEKEGFYPFVLFSEKELDIDSEPVKNVLRVHQNDAINSKKLSNDKTLMTINIHAVQKRIAEAKLYLEQLNIDALKIDLAGFLDKPVNDTIVYKIEMKAMLFDKRLHYRSLRQHTQYDTHRRYWREEKWHLIDIDFLNLERDALQKLYDTLFPIATKTYSIKLPTLDNKKTIQVSVEAKSREEAYEILKKQFPNSTFSASDLAKSNSTYNRFKDEQDTFDYLPDVDENDNNIETDPNNFV